jgi:Protein of unknown function (DUF3667)
LDNSAPRAECGNCGATLTGPYCSACGQHAHGSARSIAVLFHEAWHLATHLDGRLWQTLYILLFKPGKLTTEYFAEHRARYLPPVRLYLVLSVLFFAFGLATPEKTSVRPIVTAPDAAAPSKAAPESAAAGKAPAARGKSRSTILDIDDCDEIKIPFTWLQNSLRRSCVRNKQDNGASVEHAFVATIPKMMFLFVPMMALVMLILYWRPRRYYVEHLVFFLHAHAAVFLLLLIQALLGWIALRAAWGIGEFVAAIIGLFSAWYVYRAMRVYYGQGRLRTFTKLCAVGFSYLIGIALTFTVTALLSMLIA